MTTASSTLISSADEKHSLCAADVITPLACNGSVAHASRVLAKASGVRELPFRIKPFAQQQFRKVRFGGTPKPARETRALPKAR